jgi:hypothetical protein
VETGTMARLLRHRQTKEAETDRPGLTSTAPHSYSTVKTIACGNAGRFRCTRCYSCAFYQYKVHTRPRVQRAPGIPHALKGARDKCTARAQRVAGSGRHILICRHCKARLVRRSSTSEGGGDEAIILRHSGAMRSIEPGISRFRVWSCGPSRNDGACGSLGLKRPFEN